MIEVDHISLGDTPGDIAVGRIQGLAGQLRFGEAAEAIFELFRSPVWAEIENGTFEVDGLVLPHQSWNVIMAILLQAYAFEVVADHIKKMFNATDIVIGRKDDDKPTILDIHINDGSVVFFLHSLVNRDWMWFAALRFIGILPMIMHIYRYRRGNGSFSISMLDASSTGEPSFSSVDVASTLLPDPIFVESGGYYTLRRTFQTPPPFNERNLRAMWRGSTTGTRVTTWRTLPRAILCEMSERDGNLLDCGITNVVQVDSIAEREEIINSNLMKPTISSSDFAKYAFHIDIDGNSNSWPGLFSKLLSGGTVFKVASKEGYRQWYYDRLKPWLHYIPVETDMADLLAKIQWARNNIDRAERIGRAGRGLAASMTLGSEMDFAVAAIEAVFV
ncbi:glycosyl transferase family 90 [Acidisphaera sp. L21]|uniref:glycosyl transferase family 90 n=1 Tax=Acidisphaera sp. L21 TaxID=1641851 RepID=UPI00131D9837|nr:glycosyl transferase family 90 [Acidisphaera sp. L21]